MQPDSVHRTQKEQKMTGIGEKVAVTKIKTTKSEQLSVNVLDNCENQVIDGAEVSIGSDKKTTDSSGKADFTELPEGVIGVQAKKHFKDADYSKFIILDFR